jgi:hypothetical protein
VAGIRCPKLLGTRTGLEEHDPLLKNLSDADLFSRKTVDVVQLFSPPSG